MKKSFKITGEKRHRLEGLIFVSPFIIGTLIFFIFPLFVSIKLSFGKLKKMEGFVIEWLGLDNYIRAFILDTSFIPMFLQVIRKTIVQVPLIIVFSILLAMLINKNIKFKGLFRTIFFIPFLLGMGDVMNQLLGLGIDKHVFSFVESNLLPREFLVYLGPKVVEAVESFFGIIVVVLWSSGVQILLFLSGLQSIPVSLYESAKVDGATEWEMFWKITLPMISPIMLLTIVYTIIASFTDISNPILAYIQSNAFRSLRFEYAAAIGWVYFLFIILLVSLVFILLGNHIYTTSELKGGAKNERKDY
ncbi:MAG TPA: sugar ABC transporter permease [Clostridiales bacterium]|nr:sugar ABC transporter permease [Clostridiales bacterium]